MRVQASSNDCPSPKYSQSLDVVYDCNAASNVSHKAETALRSAQMNNNLCTQYL